MSTILMPTRSSPAQFSVVVGTSASIMTPMSSEVPPMSKESTFLWPAVSPAYMAAAGAAAGPDPIR